MIWIIYTIIIVLLIMLTYYAYGLLIISKNKIIVARARAINDAIMLCITDAYKVDDDQIAEYSQGWADACVHIGERLSEIRDVAISEVKARQ